MSILIVGGNDRMVSQYRFICEKYRCKVKIFTQMPKDFKSRIGRPDLLILFTGTVSHQMVLNATQEVSKDTTKIVRSHSSSCNALKNILKEHL